MLLLTMLLDRNNLFTEMTSMKALLDLLFAQLLNLSMSKRFYRFMQWRMLISWAVWIDLAGRVCHALAFTSSALDSLAPFSIQKNKLGNWLVWFLAALGSMMLLLESLLLILNTQDPWYAICVPPLVFKARSKLSGLSIGFAFWGGLSLALGCLG